MSDSKADASSKSTQPKNFKTSLCTFYLAGDCKGGSECPFAHGTNDLRTNAMLSTQTDDKFKTSLCVQFLQYSACDSGPDCRYAHGIRELRKPSDGKSEAQFGTQDNQDMAEKNPFYKVTLCANYMGGMYCPYADKCNFAHGRHEMRTRPSNLSVDDLPDFIKRSKKQRMQETDPTYKTRLCAKFTNNGYCDYGIMCLYAHGMGELLKTSMCKMGENCTSKDTCLFAHSTEELHVPTVPSVKTAMCQNILSLGECPRGSECMFAHSQSELAPPSLTTQSQYGARTVPVGPVDNFKTAMCRHMQNTGNCQLGSSCNFAHSELELRTVGQPRSTATDGGLMAYGSSAAGGGTGANNRLYKTSLCKNYSSKGTCEVGSACLFAHGNEELRKPTSNPYSAVSAYGTAGAYGTTSSYPSTAYNGSASNGVYPSGVTSAYGYGTPTIPTAYSSAAAAYAGYGGGAYGSTAAGYGTTAAGYASTMGLMKKRQREKTALCKTYLETGKCSYGDKCTFAHGEDDLADYKKVRV